MLFGSVVVDVVVEGGAYSPLTVSDLPSSGLKYCTN